MDFKLCLHIYRLNRNKSPLKISGKVVVGVVRDSWKFSGHPYRAHHAVIFAIAQLSCFIIIIRPIVTVFTFCTVIWRINLRINGKITSLAELHYSDCSSCSGGLVSSAACRYLSIIGPNPAWSRGLNSNPHGSPDKIPVKISGKVAVGVVRDSWNFSGHPYNRAHRAVIFAIAVFLFFVGFSDIVPVRLCAKFQVSSCIRILEILLGVCQDL